MKNCDLNATSYVLYATLISIVISSDLTTDEQNLVGNFLMMVGQNIVSIAGFPDCNNDDKDTV